MALDIGGTTIKAALVDRDGTVMARLRRPTPPHDNGPDEVLAAMLATIDELTGAAPRSDGVRAVGLAVTGIVDERRGMAVHSQNVGWRNVPVRSLVEQATRLPVGFGHDVRAGTLAEWRLGAGRGFEDLVFVPIGTGVSAGVVVGGELFRGRDGLAGEIGHVVVDEDGPECACGLRGCLEAVVAGPALRAMWPSADGKHAQDLYRAAAAGDAAAAAAAHRLTVRLTETVQWLAIAYGADLLVMGGGVGSLGEPLLSSIRDRLSAFADRSELAGRMVPPDRVVAMPTGHPTGAIGAAVLARQRLGDGGAGSKGGVEARTAATGSDGGGST